MTEEDYLDKITVNLYNRKDYKYKDKTLIIDTKYYPNFLKNSYY